MKTLRTCGSSVRGGRSFLRQKRSRKKRDSSRTSPPRSRRGGKCSFDILEDWRDRFIDAYNAEFQSWVDHTRMGVVAGPSAWDGYASIAVAEACLRSRETGKDEPVSIGETPAFYQK